MRNIMRVLLVSILGLFLAAGMSHGADKVSSETLVDRATAMVKSFSADPNLGWFRDKVKGAKALLIIPQSLKGAFVIGGSGGSGVLVVQDGSTGEWGYPAFYTLGSISFGLQAGAESSEVVLMIMTERGMEKLLASSFKLGADLTLAAGPIGEGHAAQTADVLSYSRSKGAFAGLSFDGAVVKTRDKRNEAYYGKPVSPTDVIIRKTVTNPQADELRAAVKVLSE